MLSLDQLDEQVIVEDTAMEVYVEVQPGQNETGSHESLLLLGPRLVHGLF